SDLASGLPADALGGRIGRAKIRVRLSEGGELTAEFVEVGVGNAGVVEQVVAVVVRVDFARELCVSLRRVHRHRWSTMRLAAIESRGGRWPSSHRRSRSASRSR